MAVRNSYTRCQGKCRIREPYIAGLIRPAAEQPLAH